MSRSEITQSIVRAGAVAILRLPSSSHVLRAAEAVVLGGITAIEVTLTTPGALLVTEQLARELSGAALLGVGSVMHANHVAAAADRGAQFIVSPVASQEIIACAHERNLAVMPGALTPAEVHQAQAHGADLVKVFPAGFWGPRYVRALLAPMPELQLCPTGGVTPENAGAWIQAGAKAVGIGSALAAPALVSAGRFNEVTRRARILVQSLESARPQTNT